jgi:ribokinase
VISTPRLAVVGSANVDYIVAVDVLPTPGATVLGSDVVVAMGGKGANQAVAAARLGADVQFIGAIGDDAAGSAVRANLVRAGVDVTRLATSALPTGVALITVDREGENTIVVAPGANRTVTVVPNDREVDMVVAQLEIPLATIEALLAGSVPVILNVAPPLPLSDELLARCHVVIANETEAQVVAVHRAPRAVVTRGAAGADYFENGELVATARPPIVDVVDAVGAGDAFCAAFAVRLATGDEPADALRYAVTAGALATQSSGAQGALPTHEEVCAWLARA